MFQKDSTVMSVQTLINRTKKGQVTFNNVVQRGDIWKKDISRRSLFIHSLLGNYPVPPLYANKVSLVYDMLDGKQRSTTIVDFFDNGFCLSDDTPIVRLESGDGFEVAGMCFDDLPEELQDRIRDFPLAIHYVENATQEEIREIFLRLNFGKAMTDMELSRVKSQSMELIQDLAKHQIIQMALSKDAKNRYSDEEYIIKTWTAIYNPRPSFESKDIRALFECVVITPDHATEINAYYDRVFEAYQHIQAETRNSMKVLSKFKGIHLIGLVVMAKQSIEDEIAIECFAGWIKKFFSSADGGISVDSKYNEASGKGLREGAFIKARHSAMLRHYKKELLTNV